MPFASRVGLQEHAEAEEPFTGHHRILTFRFDACCWILCFCHHNESYAAILVFCAAKCWNYDANGFRCHCFWDPWFFICRSSDNTLVECRDDFGFHVLDLAITSRRPSTGKILLHWPTTIQHFKHNPWLPSKHKSLRLHNIYGNLQRKFCGTINVC